MILVSSRIEFSLRMCGLMKPRVSPIFIATEVRVRADDLSPFRPYKCHIHVYGIRKPQQFLFKHSARSRGSISRLDRSIAGVMAAVMSVADVRSVSDAEALLAQLDREEVSPYLPILGSWNANIND